MPYSHCYNVINILYRSWCPDRTTIQARKYISEAVGVRYAEGVLLDLEKMWEESVGRVPMIGLLSMGSDPTNAIDALAKKMGLGNIMRSHDPVFIIIIGIECRAVSMGQGQEVHARRSLQQCQQGVSTVVNIIIIY